MENETRAIIASRIKEARLMAGLSQAELAILLKVPRPSISELESGNRKVSAEELVQLSDLLDVSVNWLTGRAAEKLDLGNSQLRGAARELSKLKPKDLEIVLKILAALPGEDDT